MKATEGSAHVVIIVTLIVALAGALGWIFWQNVLSPKTEIGPEHSSTKATTSVASAEKSHSITIGEWGVGADYDTSKDTMVYKIDGSTALFIAKYLLGIGCDYGGSGYIQRFAPSDEVSLDEIGENTVLAQDAPREVGLKKLDGYYYRTIGPQATCAEISIDRQVEAVGLRKNIFENLVSL